MICPVRRNRVKLLLTSCDARSKTLGRTAVHFGSLQPEKSDLISLIMTACDVKSSLI